MWFGLAWLVGCCLACFARLPCDALGHCAPRSNNSSSKMVVPSPALAALRSALLHDTPLAGPLGVCALALPHLRSALLSPTPRSALSNVGAALVPAAPVEHAFALDGLVRRALALVGAGGASPTPGSRLGEYGGCDDGGGALPPGDVEAAVSGLDELGDEIDSAGSSIAALAQDCVGVGAALLVYGAPSEVGGDSPASPLVEFLRSSVKVRVVRVVGGGCIGGRHGVGGALYTPLSHTPTPPPQSRNAHVTLLVPPTGALPAPLTSGSGRPLHAPTAAYCTLTTLLPRSGVVVLGVCGVTAEGGVVAPSGALGLVLAAAAAGVAVLCIVPTSLSLSTLSDDAAAAALAVKGGGGWEVVPGGVLARGGAHLVSNDGVVTPGQVGWLLQEAGV